MNEVYEWLIENKNKLMFKFIYKMIPNKNDAEDFFQDLFLIISDKDPVKMKRIYDNDEMPQYIYVIIKNNLRSKNSRYYYKYRKPLGVDIESYIDEDDDEEINKLELVDDTISEFKKNLLEELERDYKKLLNKIEKYFNIQILKNPRLFYDKEIFYRYYNNDSTYRSLSKELGIPTTSIYNTVKRNKERIEVVFRKEIKAIEEKLYIYYNEDIN